MSMDFLVPGTVNVSELPREPWMLTLSLHPHHSPAALKRNLAKKISWVNELEEAGRAQAGWDGVNWDKVSGGGKEPLGQGQS